ncbi:hypothetical protein FRC03_000207 [Tulasnella sp. 419]|nr:hypothetical protein FRC03_000207 [Tulasnella sp. 419]
MLRNMLLKFPWNQVRKPNPQPQKSPKANEIKLSGPPCTSSPINQLPVELLEAIFLENLRHAYRYRAELLKILLVCRRWRSVASRLELISIQVEGEQRVSKLISHIIKLRKANHQEVLHAPTNNLSIKAEWSKPLPELGGLLELLGSSLEKLEIDGDYDGRSLSSSCIQRTTIELPKLRELCFSKGRPEDLVLLLCASRSTLQSLYIFTTSLFILPAEGDWKASFPSLHQLRLTDHTIPLSTCMTLCALAPNLEYLEVSILRGGIDALVGVLRSLPKSMKELMVWIRVGKYDSLTGRDPEVRPLLDCIKEKGWKKEVIAHMSCGSWTVDDD